MKNTFNIIALFSFLLSVSPSDGESNRSNLPMEFKTEWVREEAYRPVDFDRDGTSEFLLYGDDDIIKYFLPQDKSRSAYYQENLHNYSIDGFWIHDFFDFDGDGDLEIFIGIRKSNEQKLRIYEHKEKIYKEIALVVGEDLILPYEGWDGGSRVEGVFDVDGDGNRDIITLINTAYDRQPRGVVVYNGSTRKEIWHYFFGPNVYECEFADLTGDGNIEIILGTEAPCNGTEVNGFNDCHTYVIVLSSNGLLLWSRTMAEGFSKVDIAAVDIDKDGEIEVIAQQKVGVSWEKSPFPDTTFILNGKTGIVENKVTGSNRINGMAVADLDGDKMFEVLTLDSEGLLRVYDFSLQIKSEKVVWDGIHNFGYNPILLIEDFNADSILDIVIEAPDQKILLLDGNLKLLAEYPTGVSGVTVYPVYDDTVTKLLVRTAELTSVLKLERVPSPMFGRSLFLLIFGTLGLLSLGGIFWNFRRVRERKKTSQSPQEQPTEVVQIAKEKLILEPVNNRLCYMDITDSTGESMLKRRRKLNFPVAPILLGCARSPDRCIDFPEAHGSGEKSVK